MWLYFGDVEWVELVIFGFVIGYELYFDGLGWIVVVGNVVEEVFVVDVWVIIDDCFGLVSSYVVNILVIDEVVFYLGDFFFGVNL